MAFTRGSENKRKRFNWHYEPFSKKVQILNEDGKEHTYSVHEVQRILARLYKEFGLNYFPLANNVENLGNGTETMGLGMIILFEGKKEIRHAQGASYLGVVLENVGYLKWNGKTRGIEWRLIDNNFELPTIENRLKRKIEE